MFAWSDLNGDGMVQPEEVQFAKAAGGGMTVMPDLSIVASRVDDRAMRFAPVRFTAAAHRSTIWPAAKRSSPKAQAPTSSGGDQALRRRRMAGRS